jgi:hypothetical protein
LSSSPPSSGTVNIFTPKELPFGETYEAHIKKFWKWILELPKYKNPWYDETGTICTREQPAKSKLFYLGGNGGGRIEGWNRTCTVPSGKGLFIPVLVVAVSQKDFPHKNIQELSKIAKKDQDSVTNLYLKIDSKQYDDKELGKYRTRTGKFSVTFPENAIFETSKGDAEVVTDGHYIITDKLSKGNHIVHYKSSLTCWSDGLEPKFAQDIKYSLIVE